MKEEKLYFLHTLGIILLIVAITLGVSFVIFKIVPVARNVNYERQMAGLEEKLGNAKTEDAKLYYKMQILETQEAFDAFTNVEGKLWFLVAPLFMFVIYTVSLVYDFAKRFQPKEMEKIES